MHHSRAFNHQWLFGLRFQTLWPSPVISLISPQLDERDFGFDWVSGGVDVDSDRHAEHNAALGDELVEPVPSESIPPRVQPPRAPRATQPRWDSSEYTQMSLYEEEERFAPPRPARKLTEKEKEGLSADGASTGCVR